jgi:hypothetical protein
MGDHIVCVFSGLLHPGNLKKAGENEEVGDGFGLKKCERSGALMGDSAA